MISVIIPVYKVEKYLDRCLKSITNQTYRDLEIILVDDESPDNCPILCDIWANKDSRIKVIHKKNEGAGYARNSGLKIAKGKWISFIDADDYIDLTTYEECITKLEKTKSDICYFGYNKVKSNGEIEEVTMKFPNTLSKKDISEQLLPKCFGGINQDLYTIGSVWRGIYSNDLIKKENIQFVSERELISEDFIFNAEICSKANKITFINKYFYYYYVNSTSLSNTYCKNRNSTQKIIEFHKNREKNIKKLKLNKEALIRAEIRYLDFIIDYLKKEINNKDITKETKIQKIKEICNNEISIQLNKQEIYPYLNIKKKVLLSRIKCKHIKSIYLLIKLKYSK